MEIHSTVDQFIRVEKGRGIVHIKYPDYDEHISIEDGSAIVIPAGTLHNVINTSTLDSLHLYTIYSPPEHPDGEIKPTKYRS
jgi:mannose-6-phosphate isomerase-like protein (cupin superfamily)